MFLNWPNISEKNLKKIFRKVLEEIHRFSVGNNSNEIIESPSQASPARLPSRT